MRIQDQKGYMMQIFELKDDDQKTDLLNYLKQVNWGAARLLEKVIRTDCMKEKLGKDARIFYAKDQKRIIGFFTIVNQDYIPLEKYDRFIAMVWVDPAYRGRGLSKVFVQHAEQESGVDSMHILTQHKGLYEKMGYHLIREFTGSFHDLDYLYEKKLG